jgi:Tol biopolymer transport system component
VSAATFPAAPPDRALAPGQRCRVRVADLDGSCLTVWEGDDLLLEAPNWDTDDRLVLNGDGRLWELPADGGPLVPIDAPGLPPVNNDHVLSPDGTTIFASANDWHLWAVPRAGGVPRRVTADDGRMHFLHGVSPDATTLAYAALVPEGEDWWAHADLRLVGVDGTGDRALTSSPRPDDGPEFSPDGRWVYFNTEMFTHAPGHAQIARTRPDGTGVERLTHDGRVDWFPHLSPTTTYATYLSYPPGTIGHPADLPVQICLVEGDDWDAPVRRIELFGGQGTLNVNSWSPRGNRFAFVDYPMAAHAT